MADKEAKIRIGIENASQTIADVTKIAGAFRGILPALEGVVKLAKNAASAIADIKPLNPKEQTDNLEKYRLSMTRLSVAMGMGAQGADQLRRTFDQLSNSSGFKSEEIAEAAEHYGKLTRNLKEATKNMGDLVTASNNMNRSPHEMAETAANLVNNYGVPHKQVGAELRQIGRIAQGAGTQGGQKGLMDMLSQLGSQSQKFDTSTPEKRSRLEAFIALAGGNLPHDAATENASSALSWIEGDKFGLGRYLGHKIYDEGSGKIQDPGQIMEEIKRKVGRSRDRAAEIRVLGRYTNLQAAPIFIRKSFGSDISKLSYNPETDESAAMKKYEKDAQEYEESLRKWAETPPAAGQPLGEPSRLPPQFNNRIIEEKDNFADTPAGKLERAYRENENLQREMVDPLLKARDRYQGKYDGKRAEQIGDETTIQMLKDTPGLSTVGDIFQGAAAAGAYGDSQKLVEETKETNRLLRAQHEELKSHPQKIGQHVKPDRNSSDVDRRKNNRQ